MQTCTPMHARELQRPLGQAEVNELREFLATAPGAMSVPEAHGFLTGIASAPTTIMPSVWQSELLGESSFASMPQAQRVMGLVMRLYNQVITALTDNKPFAPPNRRSAAADPANTAAQAAAVSS